MRPGQARLQLAISQLSSARAADTESILRSRVSRIDTNQCVIYALLWGQTT